MLITFGVLFTGCGGDAAPPGDPSDTAGSTEVGTRALSETDADATGSDTDGARRRRVLLVPDDGRD